MPKALLQTGNSMNAPQKKRWRTVFVIIIVVLVLLLITAGVFIFLALQDDNREKYKIEPSTDIIMKGVVAAGTGDEVEVTAEQLNGFFAYLLSIKSREASEAPIRIETLYMNPQSADDSVGVYLGCTYKGTHLGITARGFFTFDAVENEFSFDISEMKVGRLSLSPGFVFHIIGGSLPEGIKAQGNRVTMDATKLKLTLDGVKVPLQLKGFRVQNGSLYLKTTGMMDAVKQFAKEQFGDKLGDNSELLDELIDSFGGLFEDFLKSLQS